MAEPIESFYATFRGGVGKNGFVKESDVEVRVYADGVTEYRFLWRRTLALLPIIGKMLGGGWHKGIYDLCGKDEFKNWKYPFAMKDKYQGGECVQFRVYNMGLNHEPYHENLMQSSLAVQAHQLGLELMEKNQLLATAHRKSNVMASGDRMRKEEEESAKHHKKIRSHYTFNDFPRGIE